MSYFKRTYTVIEVAYNDNDFYTASMPKSTPTSRSNIIQLRTDSIFFYKENLLNIASKKTDKKYTKFIYIDADIIFADRNWYNIVSDLLENHDGVQPFINKLDLSAEFTIDNYHGYSVILDKNIGLPGLTWAVHRNWFEKYGIFDYCVIGGGDRVFSYFFAGQDTLLSRKDCSYLTDSFAKYSQKDGTKITGTVAPITIFHMFHSCYQNRQYTSRTKIITDFMQKYGLNDIHELLEYQENGLLVWRPKYKSELNDLLLKFFLNRNDDSILK